MVSRRCGGKTDSLAGSVPGGWNEGHCTPYSLGVGQRGIVHVLTVFGPSLVPYLGLVLKHGLPSSPYSCSKSSIIEHIRLLGHTNERPSGCARIEKCPTRQPAPPPKDGSPAQHP